MRTTRPPAVRTSPSGPIVVCTTRPQRTSKDEHGFGPVVFMEASKTSQAAVRPVRTGASIKAIEDDILATGAVVARRFAVFTFSSVPDKVTYARSAAVTPRTICQGGSQQTTEIHGPTALTSGTNIRVMQTPRTIVLLASR